MSSLVRVFAVLLVLLTMPRSASGQFESEKPPLLGVPVAVWGSVALGSGNTREHGEGLLASALRANVSVGPWLLTYRGGNVGPFMDAGDGIRDEAMLAGMRMGGNRLFASGALGYARVTPYERGDQAGALAYDATVHANAYVVGLAVSVSGAIGPARSTYSAVTLGVEVGWFGR